MITKVLLGGAVALALSSMALAQAAGAGGAGAAGSAGAGAAAGGGAGTGTAAGPAIGSATGSATSNAPGVATGVQPYQPAGVGGGATGAGSINPDASISGGINSTLQAGQVQGGSNGTIGGASAGGVTRMPNTASGNYNNGASPTYGAPSSAVPYTGPAGTTGASGTLGR